MKVSRARGGVRVRLAPPESEVLADLFDQLDSVVTGSDPDDPVVQRLFPAAYPDDPEAETEYRELTESTLRGLRQSRVAECRVELGSGAGKGAADAVDLVLDADGGQRWIGVLNDLRLAIGTRLGITEEDDHLVDPAGPDADSRMVYYWLTGLQDAVVEALMS